MNPATLLLIESIVGAVLKAIPFIETLFGKGTGPAKLTAVTSIAQVAAGTVANGVFANNPNWSALAPLVEQFVNASVKAINDIAETPKIDPAEIQTPG